MLYRNSIGAAVLAAVFVTAIADVRAQDEMKYPDWSGQWLRTGERGRRHRICGISTRAESDL
jgi:hypothetical protein